MVTKKTTKTTTAKTTAKAAPAKKAPAAKSTKVATAAKPAVPETADMFECACAEKPAKKCAAKAPKAEKKTRVTFSVRAEVGSKVFLAGCFNNWDPTAKQLEDKKGTGEFSCSINLPKGKYEYKFVIDGVWTADGECPDWVQNDMGTINSVKIVD
ncbi:MAG: glycogen-binding domain-containing protein [Kiritimatiellae bacterium]|nr:glycogen-binding domain-containing protein [Kiritimatiellia bacterium]